MKCSYLVYFFVLICFSNAIDREKRAEYEDRNLKSSEQYNDKTFNEHDSNEYDAYENSQHNDDDFEGSDEYEPQAFSHRPYKQRPGTVYRPTMPKGPNSYERPNSKQNLNRPVRYPISQSPLLYPPNNNPNFNGNYGANVPNMNGPNYGNRPNFPQGNYPSFNNGLNTNINGNPNYNVPTGNYPNYGRPTGNMNGNQLNNNGGIGAGQCSSLTSMPPSPQTGCCGREATNNINFGAQNGYMNRPANSNQWASQYPPYPGRRYTRDTDDSLPGITLDSRIAGGKETDLLQFPWTVFLKTTFDYGTKKSAFNCGGSLISARYVLTAAHCITEDDARVSDINIMLAEFDKRTFPTDCTSVLGEGRKCITNILMEAENIIPHKQYDSVRLQNDIALIRLREKAPYTDYIRPICLPPINVDNPQYSDLRLAVAGWGRNLTATSQVKQSTVVNLVPQRQCAESYPHLTQKHLCAAGHSGEDTCKGDSGGPLMMLYEGQYYVSGVVSGKRADSPCGTNVPSLYTNVYHYIEWINQNIRY